jgi:hypothetical protein
VNGVGIVKFIENAVAAKNYKVVSVAVNFECRDVWVCDDNLGVAV